MDKEKIFSKIAPRDYHNELETILEYKNFSEDVKNLLLSCIYKIEDGYEDYELVKQSVESKKDYLENILSIVKEKCKIIKIEKNELEENPKPTYEVDQLEGSITLWHPNEKIILYALYELDDKPIYVDEKYSLIRISLSEMLNKGENMNRIEVLRDFNGWSWNTDPKDLQNITINLVYQNLITLLGIDFMKQWIHSEKVKDYLELANRYIEKKYGKVQSKQILDYISKLSILTCIQSNEMERKRLKEEKDDLEKELAKLDNKTALLEEISKNNKDYRNQIKEIDTLLSDGKLLAKEFEQRNSKLPEYHKIMNLAHLAEILTRQRKKIMKKMEEENKILDPDYYIKVKSSIQERLELLLPIDMKYDEQYKKIVEYSILLQKVIMACFKMQVEEIDKLEKNQKKEEIIKAIYKFRYYNYLYIENDKRIFQEAVLEKQIRNIEKGLIYKAIELKCMSQFVKNERQNYEISHLLFSTKTINLSNLDIELKWEEELKVLIYETDILEKEISVQVNRKDVIAKFDKKIKLLG